ncbi:hypothetical protein ACOME3_000254 [Neoechinorhynchus agilis]
MIQLNTAVYALMAGPGYDSRIYGYFFNENILRHIELNSTISNFVILARFVPFENPNLLVVTFDGARILIDQELNKANVMDQAIVPSGKVRSAFIDPLTGIVICQQEPLLDSHLDTSPDVFIGRQGAYEPIFDSSGLPIFVYDCRNNFEAPTGRIPVSYSRLLQPDLDFLLTGSTVLLTLHKPGPSSCGRDSKRNIRNRNDALSLLTAAVNQEDTMYAYQDISKVLAELVADLIFPYWNKPLAVLVKDVPATQIPCDDVIYLSVILDRLTEHLSSKHPRQRCLIEFLMELRDLIHAWRFVSSEHQLHLVVEQVDQDKRTELRNRLLTTTLNELLRDDNGQILNDTLRGLINLYVDDSAATDSLMQRLSRLSSRIFSPGTSYLGYAYERVHRLAKLDIPADSRRRLITEIYNNLDRAGADVDLGVWAPILCRYRDFHGDLARLTLTIANRYIDPTNRALQAYDECAATNEEDERIFAQRMDAYRIVLNACQITQLMESDLIQTLLRSQDLLAHVAVYQNIMEIYGTRSQDALLELGPSRSLEKFLKQLFGTSNLTVFASITLCKLYQKAGENQEACSVLCHLATLPSAKAPDMSINDRIDHLSQAILIAKSTRVHSQQPQLVTQLTRWLNGARLQANLAEHMDSMLSRELMFGDLLDMTELYHSGSSLFRRFCESQIRLIFVRPIGSPVIILSILAHVWLSRSHFISVN